MVPGTMAVQPYLNYQSPKSFQNCFDGDDCEALLKPECGQRVEKGDRVYCVGCVCKTELVMFLWMLELGESSMLIYQSNESVT